MLQLIILCFFTVYSASWTPEFLRKTEKNVCTILPDVLKNPIVARKECAHVAKKIRDTYFDGKPFDSSILRFADVSANDSG